MPSSITGKFPFRAEGAKEKTKNSGTVLVGAGLKWIVSLRFFPPLIMPPPALSKRIRPRSVHSTARHSNHLIGQQVQLSVVPESIKDDERVSSLYSTSLSKTTLLLILLFPSYDILHACVYVCMVTHIARVWINRVIRLPVLHVVG